MVKKIGFGILWFIVIYMASCMIVGGIAGASAGKVDPQNAYAAGQIAGASAVASIRGYLLFGALLISVIGSIKGFLPGTKAKKE